MTSLHTRQEEAEPAPMSEARLNEVRKIDQTWFSIDTAPIHAQHRREMLAEIDRLRRALSLEKQRGVGPADLPAALDALPAAERVEIFDRYCRHCGDIAPLGCHCMNDE